MNELEFLLITIGDLELARRKQAVQIQELQKELEERDSSNKAGIKRSPDFQQEPTPS
jgi:hypothetical protein